MLHKTYSLSIKVKLEAIDGNFKCGSSINLILNISNRVNINKNRIVT
jgi:hypothetical protein